MPVAHAPLRWAQSAAALAVVALAIPARAATRSYRVLPDESELVVHVFKAGAFSPVLHDHHFVPGEWSGHATFDPERPAETTAVVTVQADSLRDRQPKLSKDDLAKVNAQVRGPEVLDAAKYPTIRFEAKRLELDRAASDPAKGYLRGKLFGALTLHGRTRTIGVPVAARWSGDALAVNGKVAFRQSAFGIEPYAQLGGAIAVQDAVEIELSLSARAEASSR